MRLLGDRGSTAINTMIIGEEECGISVAAKEGGKMLVTPTLISSSTPVGMATFPAWDVQGNVMSACIQ